MLPINPVDTSLFMKVADEVSSCPKYVSPTVVTGVCQAHADFDLVLPGYYSVREFSDYQVNFTTESSVKNPTTTTWETKTKQGAIGSRTGYTSYKTLLLPKVPTCERSYGAHDDWAGHEKEETDPTLWKNCSHTWLTNNAKPPTSTAEFTVDYDGPTGGFKMLKNNIGDPVPDALRINLGYLRKPIGTAITSRVIDIFHPCSELRFYSFRTPGTSSVGSIPTGTAAGDWQAGCDNLETLIARLTSTDAQSTGQIGLGLATYPFNLTLPNYSATVELNFPYEVNNALIVAVVTINNEAGVGIVSPKGVVQLPPSGNPQLDQVRAEASGFGSGTASFKFSFLPRGADRGAISFFFVPMQYDASNYLQGLGSWAKIKDNQALNETASFKLETWTPGEWPPMNYYKRRTADQTIRCSRFGLPDNDCGHTFQVNSRFNPIIRNSSGRYLDGQISGECRTISSPNESANVCEDWAVMVHSPKPPASSDPDGHITASLMDVVDASNPTSYTSIASEIVDAGGKLYTSEPRTTTATVFTAFSAGINSALTGGEPLWTNGSFFEQLVVPMPVLGNHRGSLEFCINDGLPRDGGVSTTSVSSLCAGSGTSSSWTASLVDVPCIPKVPAVPGFPCKAAALSYALPQLKSYVSYLTTHNLLQ